MPPRSSHPNIAAIPPDLAAVLTDAPIHPVLLRAPLRQAAPTAARLSEAALALAEYAAREAHAGLPARAGAHDPLPLGAEAFLHTVGIGGVLHLAPSPRPRAVSLAHGALEQRCTRRPRLRPGTVRFLPPGHAVTLANLDGNGALAVEIAL
jgi:hypothetical protein